MNRRTAVRNFIVLSTGSTLLPSCLQRDTAPVISLNNLRVNAGQEKLLAALTETILPPASTPGGKELSSHHFVLMMVDDCFNKEDQEKFTSGLTRFDELVRRQTGHSFIKTSPEQRYELLKMLESKKNLSADLVFFYITTKKLSVQSFTGSRYYLTKVRPYEMAPGRFHGCFPVTSTTKI